MNWSGKGLERGRPGPIRRHLVKKRSFNSEQGSGHGDEKKSKDYRFNSIITVTRCIGIEEGDNRRGRAGRSEGMIWNLKSWNI